MSTTEKPGEANDDIDLEKLTAVMEGGEVD
jgi:hypothetical protein